MYALLEADAFRRFGMMNALKTIFNLVCDLTGYRSTTRHATCWSY